MLGTRYFIFTGECEKNEDKKTHIYKYIILIFAHNTMLRKLRLTITSCHFIQTISHSSNRQNDNKIIMGYKHISINGM